MAMSCDRVVVLQDCVLVITQACCFEMLLRSFSATRELPLLIPPTSALTLRVFPSLKTASHYPCIFHVVK